MVHEMSAQNTFESCHGLQLVRTNFVKDLQVCFISSHDKYKFDTRDVFVATNSYNNEDVGDRSAGTFNCRLARGRG